MNWYEYLGTSLLLTGISMLPIFALSIYVLVNRDIQEKPFFILVGSLLSYGVIGVLSVATIPIEFVWNGIISPLLCVSKNTNIICKVGHFILGYGYMGILLIWVFVSVFIIKYLVTKYWDVVSIVKSEIKNANK
jgi:hypothetical protein